MTGWSRCSMCPGRSPSSLRALMNHWACRAGHWLSSMPSSRMIRRSRRCWSSESRIWKASGSPASFQCMRSRRWAMPWNVPIHRGRVETRSRPPVRSRISPAALFVKVTASTPRGETWSTWISHARRCTSTRVLPLPAPASTRTCLSLAVTASRCGSLSSSSRWETSIQNSLTCSRRMARYPMSLRRKAPSHRIRLQAS